MIDSRGIEFERLDLATGRTTPFPRPDAEFLALGRWGPRGEAYVLGFIPTGPSLDPFGSRATRGRVFRLEAGEEAAEPLGSRRAVSEFVGLAGDVVVASSCGREPEVLTLDPDGTDWRVLGPGCGRALAPDESAVVALDRSRTTLTRLPLRPDAAVDTRPIELDEAALARVGVRRPRIFEVEWGEPGLALLVGARDEQTRRWALVVLPESGDPRIVPLGQVQAGEMAWQPGGSLLALTDCVECDRFFRGLGRPYGSLRVYDAEADRMEQVASSVGSVDTPLWSPDGRLVMVVARGADLILTDPITGALERRSLEGAPMDWGP